MPRHDQPTDTPGRRQFLRAKLVAADLGTTVRTIQRWEAAGQFPRRVKLGPNSVGYVAAEVEAWKADRERRPGDRPPSRPAAANTAPTTDAR